MIKINIRFFSSLTILFQVSIILSSVIHNHTWHYLKINHSIYFDIHDENNHKDPYADKSGFCRINNYIINYYSANPADITGQLLFDSGSSYLPPLFDIHWQYLSNKSSGLRGPPSA
jgi:hypothetical protein